ncbi:hypothetical protein D918_08372 [Trichuris suis]|nr:hypothetical protein D918_08372 [Trichuris suis]
MMKTLALLILFAFVFQNEVEARAATEVGNKMDECMKNDCSSNFKDAQPCYLSPKEQNGCNEKKTSYTKCMVKCYMKK